MQVQLFQEARAVGSRRAAPESCWGWRLIDGEQTVLAYAVGYGSAPVCRASIPFPVAPVASEAAPSTSREKRGVAALAA